MFALILRFAAAVAMSPTLKISFVDVLISVVEVVEGFGWLGGC